MPAPLALRPRPPLLAAWAVLLGTSLALHARFLGGEALVAWDTTSATAPWARPLPRQWNYLITDPLAEEATNAAFHRRHGPARWNPYLALGEPAGLTLYPSLDYPPAVLLWGLLRLPHWLAQGIHSLLHVALGGILMLHYLRWRGCGPPAALGGALAYQLAPGALVWFEYTHRTVLASWAVLVLWSAEAAARRPTARAAVRVGLVLGATTLTGLIEQAPVLLHAIAGLLMVALAPRGQRARAAGLAALAMTVAVSLGAARLLPLALWAGQSNTTPLPWSEWFPATFPTGPRHLLLLLFPDLFGHPVRGVDLCRTPGAAYARIQELSLSPGVALLPLACLGARRARGFALLALALVVAAFPSPLSWLLWRCFPGFSVSCPTRILWPLHLPVAVLVGAGLEEARRDPRALARWAGGWFALQLAAGLALQTSWGAELIVPAGTAPSERGPLRELLRARWLSFTAGGLDPTARRLGPLELVAVGERATFFLPPLLGPLLTGAAALGAATLAGRSGGRRPGRALLAGLIVWELLGKAVAWNPTSAPAELFQPVPALAEARELAGEGRVLCDAGTDPNLFLPFDLRGAGGYASLHSGRTAELLRAIGAPPPIRQVLNPVAAPPPWRDALSIRVVLTAPGASPTVPDGLEPPARRDRLWLWENRAALPRARVYPPEAVRVASDRAAAARLLADPGFDPRRLAVVERAQAPSSAGEPGLEPPGAARLERDDTDELVVAVEAPRGGLLVLADSWSPGWEARDEAGSPLPVEPVDLALRGVPLPAGFRGRVTLRYRQPGLLPGRLASALTLLAGLLVLRGRGAGRQTGPGRADW